MHRNFYENLATREDVEDALREVEKLVETVERLLKQPGGGGKTPASSQP